MSREKGYCFSWGYVIVFGIVAAISYLVYYLTLPALNFKSVGFWSFLLFIGITFTVGNLIVFSIARYNDNDDHKPLFLVVSGSCTAFILLIMLIGWIGTSNMWNAEDHTNLLKDNIVNVDISEYKPDIENVPMMDTISDGLTQDTASYIANREVGSLIEEVSQFDLANGTEMILNGEGVEIFPLEFEGWIKWRHNREQGVRKYVEVNLNNKTATIKEFESGMQYVPSAFWSKDLKRHIRSKYAYDMLGETFFELDESKHPYYIVQVVDNKASLFTGKDVIGIIVVDPYNGEMKKYSVKNVPEWIDNVYDTKMIRDQFDRYSKLKNGWENSIWGQKGVTQLTPSFYKKRSETDGSSYKGYSYIPYNGELYMYSGETSVASDESNIGFVLVNLRTKEIQRYELPGAEEYSAMDAAEGVVQHLGYTATFPMMVKVNEVPTYIMQLKDAGGLVKMYGMVSVQNYQNVIVENNFEDAIKEYCKIENCGTVEIDIPEDEEKNVVEGYIEEIRTGEKSGTTYFYLKVDNQYYVISLTDNEEAILLNVGDFVKLEFNNGDTNIIKAKLD